MVLWIPESLKKCKDLTRLTVTAEFPSQIVQKHASGGQTVTRVTEAYLGEVSQLICNYLSDHLLEARTVDETLDISTRTVTTICNPHDGEGIKWYEYSDWDG